ncbi:MAG: branched-chain amino acid ABC transporter permease [Dehalococcoidales bacterium]
MNFSKINWKQLGITAGIPLIILVILGFMPNYGWDYGVTLFSNFLFYIIISVSWTMFSGATGYISLATAAFYGIGIYAAALYGNTLPLYVVVLIGGVASFILAFIVGAITLRLKGIYFAMFTFGLVLLLKEVIFYWEIVIEGTRGRIVALESNETVYYYLLAIFVITMLVAYIIRKSKYGLALQSIGENEEAAAHTGVNVTMTKILTFAISAVFMGAVGVIMATKNTYVDPSTAFNPMMSFSPALMAIFGGMGNIYGPVLGAVIFTYIQEILQTGSLKNYYMLIFGAMLVATILYLPNGLMGLIQNLWRRIKGAKSAPTRG